MSDVSTQSASPPREGSLAPDFELSDHTGAKVRLSSFRGRPVVLYFYPKNGTPACTMEACAFRDVYEDFAEVGAAVIGVSSDDSASHAAFVKSNRLPFTLLADEHGRVRELFHVPRSFLLFPGRMTFVIDPAGIIRLTFNSQLQPGEHVRRALKAIRAMAPSTSSSSTHS